MRLVRPGIPAANTLWSFLAGVGLWGLLSPLGVAACKQTRAALKSVAEVLQATAKKISEDLPSGTSAEVKTGYDTIVSNLDVVLKMFTSSS